MGRNAQVESLRHQLRARDVEIERLLGALGRAGTSIDFIEGNLERALQEVRDYEHLEAALEPVMQAALDLVDEHSCVCTGRPHFLRLVQAVSTLRADVEVLAAANEAKAVGT